MKNKFILFSVLLTLFVVSGCKSNVEPEDPVTNNTASLRGKAIYTNTDDSSSIYVVLDKTDGLRTAQVLESQGLTDKSIYRISENNVSASRAVVAYSNCEEDGTFKFENLEPGTYTVYASSPDSQEKAVYKNITLTEDEEKVLEEQLKLLATGSLNGKITLDSSEDSNSGFTVYIGGTSYMAKTGSSGEFTITGVPAGTEYEIYIEKGTFSFFWKTTDVEAFTTINLSEKNFTTEEIKKASLFTDGKDGQNGLNGKDGQDGKNGKDGTSIIWKGSFASEDEISNPKELWAYYNRTDGCSYIYDGTEWTLLASKGANGQGGQDGEDGQDGKDGTSIVWKGSFDSASEISNPKELWAYYNTTDGCSYIYDGTHWTLLASKGANGQEGHDGEDGQDGKDGTSIVWKGSFDSASEISNPKELWAYYNTTDGCSYIYDGTQWILLASKGSRGQDGEDGQDGKDGTSIVWKGSFDSASEISNPQKLWAYYNTTDGCSYIYDGTQWTLLASKGSNGQNGLNGEVSVLEVYTITYILNDGTFEELDSLHIYGKKTLLPEYGSKEGFILAGWCLKEDLSDEALTYISATNRKNVTVYAKWNPITYKISFNANGGTGDSMDEINCIYDQIYTLPENTYEKTGYVFDGWNTNIDGSGTDFTDKTNVYKLISTNHATFNLYAKWKPITYKISFNANGGTGDSMDEMNCIYNQIYTLPNNTYEKTDYVFGGWYTLNNGIEINYGNKDSIQNLTTVAGTVITFYAKWMLPVSISNLDNYLDGLISQEEPYAIAISDTNPDLSAIKSSLINHNNLSIQLDLSNCSELETIEASAFYGCSGLTSIKIPDSVTSIGIAAFYGCSGLTSIKIPDSVTSIGADAFEKCSGLTSIEIPDSVTSIGTTAFYDCTGLNSVTISNSVTSIEPVLFNYCSGLKSIEIPDGVTSIGGYAFNYCTGLRSITIPDSVTSIGGSAFNCCYNLTQIYYTGTQAQWKAITVGGGNESLTTEKIIYNYVPPKN